ncbi:hypothetical protein [Helicobacter sp.]|nr:hypothetical protein [Helicobacter sp.]
MAFCHCERSEAIHNVGCLKIFNGEISNDKLPQMLVHSCKDKS